MSPFYVMDYVILCYGLCHTLRNKFGKKIGKQIGNLIGELFGPHFRRANREFMLNFFATNLVETRTKHPS
jgi:hypothetical protein